MGLGSVRNVSLKAARQRRDEARALKAASVDPLEDRDQKRERERQQAALERARATTFRQAAENYMAAKRSGWAALSAHQWRASLTTHAYPRLGEVAVGDVDTALVLKVLTPIWETTTKTALRVRGRIEAVLDWAAASELRTGDNPARWRGHLQYKLAKPADIVAVEHRPAMPYAQVHAFVTELRAEPFTCARCLELVILTACRTNEARLARPAEFDLDARIWTIPAERMKGKGKSGRREHQVALSGRAVELVRAQLAVGSPFLFPGSQPGRPIAERLMSKLLVRLRDGTVTVHGFRSSFRDWAADQTEYPEAVVEAALAHTVRNTSVRAYKRTNHIDRRHQLMADWASYVETGPATGNVVQLRAG
jgi:integrase